MNPPVGDEPNWAHENTEVDPEDYDEDTVESDPPHFKKCNVKDDPEYATEPVV